MYSENDREERSDEMRCSSCGNEIDQVKFCPNCGTKNEAYEQSTGMRESGEDEKRAVHRGMRIPHNEFYRALFPCSGR